MYRGKLYCTFTGDSLVKLVIQLGVTSGRLELSIAKIKRQNLEWLREIDSTSQASII